MAVPTFNLTRLGFLLALWLLVFSSSSFAGPWFFRGWQADDGLPGDNVTGVAKLLEEKTSSHSVSKNPRRERLNVGLATLEN